MTAMNLNIQDLMDSNEHDPHAFLGLHPRGQDKVIRLYRPGAKDIHLEIFGFLVTARKINKRGLFEYNVPDKTTLLDYRIFHQNGLLAHDPYSFLPAVGEQDAHFFSQGVHYDLYKLLGAHLITHMGRAGVRFVVWAPAARAVSLVGDFNYWHGEVNPMRSLGSSGLWELFVPGLSLGSKYKFEIKTQTGERLLKADPYAFASELRPATASIVARTSHFLWSDQEWIQQRQEKANIPKPLNIYEVHLGSWRKDHGNFLNYRQIATQLAAYCKGMGFTHVELMPIQEHPLDESWGYQVSGFYAPTSRFGSPEDFQWFVNHLHEMGIGVILDWVPGHFPTDNFSLGRFDGTALYEHHDSRQGLHPHWNTYIFNFGRPEVSNFLLANALYWIDQMHVDGLRVDAVASMLYLDYGREQGDWIPNCFGGKENLEAINFLKHLNSIVHERFPGVYMFAEESTTFPKVSHSLADGGLGFDFKWNMGWMNDTLRYFETDTIFRNYHHQNLTFGLLYAFTERFTLVLSHDEVVHGKRSLLSKMPGDMWQQFANLRLLHSYMICQPGKKLLFMGAEIGQWNEWDCKGEIEWFLLQFPLHDGMRTMVAELNHLYLGNSCFWEDDFTYEGFEWVDFNDIQNSVISYLRKGKEKTLLCVHNFTPMTHDHYELRIANVRYLQELFNSDQLRYGGSGQLNTGPVLLEGGVRLKIAPLATMIFEIESA